MPESNVVSYSLGYSIADRQFSFYYELEGGSAVSQIFVTPEQFVALADMFRNEGPVHFNSDGGYFVTASERVGEGERLRAAPSGEYAGETGSGAPSP